MSNKVAQTRTWAKRFNLAAPVKVLRRCLLTKAVIVKADCMCYCWGSKRAVEVAAFCSTVVHGLLVDAVSNGSCLW